MRIICNSSNELDMAAKLVEAANAVGIFDVSITFMQDAYALTIWSVNDVDSIRDERVKTMSPEDKENFMLYAQRQLRDDMVERGWDSLAVLLDEYFSSLA